MILLLKYWIRHVISVCLMIAVVFMIACIITVILLIASGNIKIRKIKEDGEEKEL